MPSASARASSRIFAASVRASASWARYCSSSWLASAWAASARFRPPSIASTRAWYISSMRGKTNFIRTKQSRAKEIEPTTISCQIGRIGLCSPPSAARNMSDLPVDGTGDQLPTAKREGTRPKSASASTRAKPRNEPGPVVAGRLGLTGARVDVGNEDQGDTDGRADGGEAVADGVDAAARSAARTFIARIPPSWRVNCSRVRRCAESSRVTTGGAPGGSVFRGERVAACSWRSARRRRTPAAPRPEPRRRSSAPTSRRRRPRRPG